MRKGFYKRLRLLSETLKPGALHESRLPKIPPPLTQCSLTISFAESRIIHHCNTNRNIQIVVVVVVVVVVIVVALAVGVGEGVGEEEEQKKQRQ